MSTAMDSIINRLKEPFPFNAIECKIQSFTNDKTRGLAVFYINSRAIQTRLDEVVGPFNWRNEYVLWQDKSQICGISIFDEERKIWVTKYDGAENTDYEPIKGGLSDSMKRAAVMWGLGRYLYDIDGLWVELEQKGKNSYIKNSERQKLQDHYNRLIGKTNATVSHSPRQTSPKQETPSTSAPIPIPTQSPNPSAAYEYKIGSATENGNSTCLKLINREGKELTAYAKKGSAGIQTGVCIKNVKLDQKQAQFGTYYMLSNYEIAS